MPNIVLFARRKKKKLSHKKTFIFCAFFFGFLDQLSKYLIQQKLPEKEVLPISRFFSLTSIKNRGVCFGLGGNLNITPLIIFFSFIAIVFILFHLALRKDAPFFFQFSTGLIVGGISGNLIDRIRFGAVIDFLDFHFWPVFNLADSFIVVGVFLLILGLRPKAGGPPVKEYDVS